MIDCPRLIEVALPIREISVESVRDKNIHHAHISHLHIWWARRPLAASRAVVFASLIPDPNDLSCPDEFCKAVEDYLKTHVPVTAIRDDLKRLVPSDSDGLPSAHTVSGPTSTVLLNRPGTTPAWSCKLVGMWKAPWR